MNPNVDPQPQPHHRVFQHTIENVTHLTFLCRKCKRTHTIAVRRLGTHVPVLYSGPVWLWCGNLELPTILRDCVVTHKFCHAFIDDGMYEEIPQDDDIDDIGEEMPREQDEIDLPINDHEDRFFLLPKLKDWPHLTTQWRKQRVQIKNEKKTLILHNLLTSLIQHKTPAPKHPLI